MSQKYVGYPMRSSACPSGVIAPVKRPYLIGAKNETLDNEPHIVGCKFWTELENQI